VEAGFAGGFPLSGRGVDRQNAPFDADDVGDQVAPVGAGDDVAGVKDCDGARFVAVTCSSNDLPGRSTGLAIQIPGTGRRPMPRFFDPRKLI